MTAAASEVAVASGTLRTVLVMSAAALAVVHLGEAPAHFSEHVTSGLFFVGVAAYQLWWAATMAVRPSRSVLLAAAGNLGVVVVWVLSRTAGIPLVPGGDDVEAIGYPDVVALALEGVVVYGAMALLLSESGEWLRAPLRRSPLTLALGSALAVTVALTFAPGLRSDHPGHVHEGHALAATFAA